MNKPLVSVVVPVYNSSEYLEQLIYCMKNQIYENWELIIVDDQSTDNTVSIAKHFELIDDRINLIVRDRKPKGSTTCRNIGLKSVKGKYFINIDSDDLLSHSFLKDRVDFMENNSDCDYATFKGCSVIVSNDELYFTGKVWGEKKSEDDLVDFLETNYPFSIWNNIYRTSVFENEFWDEKVRIYTDFSFAVPILINKYKHKYSPKKEFDYFYRVEVESSMSSSFITDRKFESTNYLFNKTWEQISELPNNEKYKKAFSNFFILQYTRLLNRGTEIQQREYLSFCHNYLNKKNLKKMKLIFKINLMLTKIFENSSFVSKLLATLFYYPKNVLNSILYKLGLSKREYKKIISLSKLL